MIEVKQLSKQFDSQKALNQITLKMKQGSVFGLIGTNGAGKSTLIRILSGVIKADSGKVTIDDLPVYENPAAKQKLFYIPDEPCFFPNATPEQMMQFYQAVYPELDSAGFFHYLERFQMEKRQKINTFSKGMKKQLALILGLSAGTQYLFCDETFDGLDPVVRQEMKRVFANEIDERGLTPVLASHNLRELEDICDHIGLLHKGGIVVEQDLLTIQESMFKAQLVWGSGEDQELRKNQVFDGMEVLKESVRGSMYLATVRGSKTAFLERASRYCLPYAEALPLTLEEAFISETEVAGYDFKQLIL